MKRFSLKHNFLIFLVALLLATTPAWSQVGTTSIRGVVTDKTGAVIAAAKVSLNNVGQALTRETSTSSTGEYEFLALPPGSYTLTVQMTGFRKFENKNVQLLVNSPTTVNVTLEVGATNQTVEVSAQAVTLNTTDASLGIAFNEHQVKELPMDGRNVPDLLSLQAGVVYTGNRADINTDVDTRSGSVNGARSDQSNITLDGVDVNTSGGYAFTAALPVTLDSVQEFRVTTTNYNDDQGASSRQRTTTPIKGRRRAGRYRSSPRAVRISFMAQRTNTIAILIRARTIISLSSRSCRAASRTNLPS